MKLSTLLGVALSLIAGAVVAAEKLPANMKLTALEAYPPKIEIVGEFEYRQLLVIGKLESGEQVDLTRSITPSTGLKTVSVSADGLVRPTAEGNEELKLTFADKSITVPISVTGLAQEKEVSFVRDVQPALSKMGCNSGTCHGAQNGKNGFKLSLRGYDAQADYLAFTDELGARRFNRTAPEQSLMLLKATGSIPHVGGVRTKVEDPYYKLIVNWITEGVKLDLASPRVAKIDLYPRDVMLPLPEMKQQMTVLATFTDGTTRDVTREAFIESGDIEVLEANASGLITALRRGESPVLARYEGAYTATTITVMGDRSGYQWSNPQPNNFIDDLVYKKLQRVKILPSELCTDEEFLRRVYLDLTGVPPSADEVRAFLADSRETKLKRDELVDRLVGGREYVEHWTNKWADLMQVNRKFLGEEGSLALRNWIKQSLAENKPYDKFAFEILNASGSTRQNPPAAYYKIMRDPTAIAENTTQLFLAVRFNCNKCHDHPFERWTQDQYYHLAAYFAQIGRKEDPAFAGQKIGGTAVEGDVPLVEYVFDSGAGDVKHQRTNLVAEPQFPYESGAAPAGATRREQLAHWITTKENRYFAKSYANRLWGYLFGRGIIEPIDDIRAGNPATNPELLDALTKDFVESGFNMQHMLRNICKSRTYQHSIRTNDFNADDTLNYSHNMPRRLPAEVLYDSIYRATGATSKFPGLPAGFRAAQLPDGGVRDPFLDDFGRPPRESACECERQSGMVLGPVMKLINGPTVSEALGDPNNSLAKLVATEPNDTKVVEEVFLRLLARKPSAEETKLGIQAMQQISVDLAQQQAALTAYEKELSEKQVVWEKSIDVSPRTVEWKPLDVGEMKSTANATFTKQPDGAVLVTGKLSKDTYTIEAAVDAKGITGFKLEALPHESLPGKGPGRAPNGNFVLSELKIKAAPKADPTKAPFLTLLNPNSDFNQSGYAVNAAFDGNNTTGWAIMPQFGKPHHAFVETQENVGFDGGTLFTFTMVQAFTDGQHALGHFKLWYTQSPRPFSPPKLPEPVLAVLQVAPEKRTAEQLQTLRDHYRGQDVKWAELTNALKRSTEQEKNPRLVGVQDLAWALINSPAFLFNR